LDVFLDTLASLPQNDPPYLDQSVNPTSDSCVECSSTVEEGCLKFTSKANLPDRRWHTKCLRCSICRRFITPEQAFWSESRYRIVCDSCARNRNVQKDITDLQPGFELVTLLTQFIFLLRVALARLGSILRDNKALPHTSGTQPR
jgi:LIM domain